MRENIAGDLLRDSIVLATRLLVLTLCQVYNEHHLLDTYYNYMGVLDNLISQPPGSELCFARPPPGTTRILGNLYITIGPGWKPHYGTWRVCASFFGATRKVNIGVC